MSAIYRLDRARGTFFDAAGRWFDPAKRRWFAATTVASDELETVDAIAAVTWLQRESGQWLRVPIGVIGPREATAAQLAVRSEERRVGKECRSRWSPYH